MEIKCDLIRKDDVHFDRSALAHAVQELIPHLTGRELERNAAHDSQYLVAKAYICIAWVIKDAVRLKEAEREHFEKHPIGHHPFHKYHVRDAISVAGLAFLYDCSRPWKREAKIEDVVVHPDYRGKGVGKQLLKTLLGCQDCIAREYRFSVITLTSRPERVAANKLYASLGFERHETNVYRLTP